LGHKEAIVDRDIGTMLREIAKVTFGVVAAPIRQRQLQPVRLARVAGAARAAALRRRLRLAA
jgi:hypothetical protein